jgi:hypothetical protein
MLLLVAEKEQTMFSGCLQLIRLVAKAFVFGCMASVQACVPLASERPAVPIDDRGHGSSGEKTRSGLRISGEELTSFSSRYFGALELTFENTSATWLHVQRVFLDFGGARNNDGVLIPYGQDIQAWHDATVHRNAIRDINQQLVLGAVALTGTVVAGSTDNPTARSVGGLAALGALGALAVGDVQSTVEHVERVGMFPRNHLLAGPFGVPPGLAVKKWILLNTKDSSGDPCIHRMVVSYTLKDRPFERVFLRFKEPTAWQEESCANLFRKPERRTG